MWNDSVTQLNGTVVVVVVMVLIVVVVIVVVVADDDDDDDVDVNDYGYKCKWWSYFKDIDGLVMGLFTLF